MFLLHLTAWTTLLGCQPGAGEDPTDPATDPLPTSTERRVLHEMFSGSNCGPCLEADERVMEILAANPGRTVHIAYQVGSDPYMSHESVGRIMYYLPYESTYSIPYLHADGWNHLHPNLENDGVGYVQEDFDRFAEPTSPLDISVTHEIDGQTIDFHVTLQALSDMDSPDLVLHAAIIEGVTYNNVGSNGQTEFHHVMKKMVPDDEGTPLDSLSATETLEQTLSWTFNGDYASGTGPSNMVDHAIEHTVEDFEDLSVVVWVQDRATWEVPQSAWSGDH